MRRLGLVLMLVALAPLALAPSAMAAGGQNPGQPGKITGPAVSGTVVIDPHEIGVPLPLINPPAADPEAKHGTLRLQKGTRSASAIFSINPDPLIVPYTCGCDVKLTNSRFLNHQLPSLIGPDLVIQMFTTLGMIPPGGDLTALPGIPIITDINGPVCTGSRDASGALITIPNLLPTVAGTCQVTQAQGSTLGVGSYPIAGTLSFDVVVQFFIQQ